MFSVFKKNSYVSAIITINLLAKISYSLLIILLLITHKVSAEALTENNLPTSDNVKQTKLIFGTTNSPNTYLFKQADTILTHAFAKLGYEFSLVNLPNKRNLLWANDDKIDGIAFRIDSLDDLYPNLIRVEESIFSIEHWVYSGDNIEVNGWESLYPYTVAYEQGSLFIEENLEYLQKVILATSSESAFALVYKQRADLTIASQSTGDAILELNRTVYANKIRRQSPALIKTVMFSYLHQKHQQLAFELAQVLKKMKASGEYQALIKQIK